MDLSAAALRAALKAAIASVSCRPLACSTRGARHTPLRTDIKSPRTTGGVRRDWVGGGGALCERPRVFIIRRDMWLVGEPVLQRLLTVTLRGVLYAGSVLRPTAWCQRRALVAGNPKQRARTTRRATQPQHARRVARANKSPARTTHCVRQEKVLSLRRHREIHLRRRSDAS
jgi:hypothetical protein